MRRTVRSCETGRTVQGARSPPYCSCGLRRRREDRIRANQWV